MYYSSRLSRIAHPRGTLMAMILVAVVFLGFGVWAQAHTLPADVANAGSLDCAGSMLTNVFVAKTDYLDYQPGGEG